MREIKFRGWAPNVGWFNYYEITINDENYISGDVEELEQFTGTKDVAGTEIYEEDILESPRITGQEP